MCARPGDTVGGVINAVIDAVIFDWGGTLTPWHDIDPVEQWLAAVGDDDAAAAAARGGRERCGRAAATSTAAPPSTRCSSSRA